MYINYMITSCHQNMNILDKFFEIIVSDKMKWIVK